MKIKKITAILSIMIGIAIMLAFIPFTASAAEGDIFYGSLDGTQFSSDSTAFEEYLTYKILTEPVGESTAYSGTVRITSKKITTANTHLVIPAYVTYSAKLYKVTEIGSSVDNGTDVGVFAGSVELASVSLPEGVACYGATFRECTNLTAVYGLLKNVNYRMFYGCTSLEEVYLDNLLPSIGVESFRRSGLRHIVLPSRVKSVPSMAFLGCTNLESVTFMYSTTNTGNTAALEISDDAFNDIESLELYVVDPNSALIDLYGATQVKRLNEDYAYDNYIVQLSASSFVYNGEDQTPVLTLDDYSNALVEGEHYEIVYYTRDGQYTTDLTNVGTVGMMVYGIPSGGYVGYLTGYAPEYTITPASLNLVAQDMILIPGEVYEDTNGSKLKTVVGLRGEDKVASATLKAHETENNTRITVESFVVHNAEGDDVTANYTFNAQGKYGSAAFVVNGFEYRALTHQRKKLVTSKITGRTYIETVPGTATVLGRADGNTDTDLVLADTVTVNGNIYNVTKIANAAFYGDTVLKSVTLSKYIETIDILAFCNCTNLTSVTLNDGLTTICSQSFGATGLTEISVPDSVETIVNYAFPQNITIYVTADSSDAATTYAALAENYATVKTVVDISNNVSLVTATLTATSFDYDASEHKPVFASITYDGSALVLGTHYELVYMRNNVVTDDLTSAGTITVLARGLESGGYRGSYGLTYTIEGVPVTVIARDKTVTDGETVDGTAIDLIYFGLQYGDYIESVKLTADGERLIPSAIVVKNASGEDVSSSYKATYVDGRSFTGFEKSIVSVEKTASDGNIDTYTITFSDGSTYDFTIENGSDGKDGSAGAAGAVGATPELRINDTTNEWEVSYDGGSTWTSLGVKATGEPGAAGTNAVAPQVRINGDTNMWEVSYDNGSTWTSLGVKATGDPGAAGTNAVAPQVRINAETNMWEVSYDNGSTWTSLGVKATGDPGAAGTNAVAPQVRINAETNMWEVSYDSGTSWTSLGVKATGEQGEKGEKGDTGAAGNTGATGVTPKLQINTQTMMWEVSYDNGTTWDSLGVSVSEMDTIQGENGVTPQLRINTETNEWEVSYDNGSSWTSLGVKATGTNGADGAPGTDGKDAVAPQLRINTETNEWEVSYDAGASWVTLGVKATGTAGVNGENGADGVTPQIRINTETNMWEVSYNNGEAWVSLNVSTSDMETIHGKDGVTPQLRINTESNVWEVSYDEGISWQSLEIKATGEAGADGATGAQGPQGEKGDKGDTGEQGPQGEKGDKGDTGEQGPQGAQGKDGTDGQDGASGNDGVDGVAIASVAMSGLSLVGIISLAGYMIIKKKLLF